MAIQIGEPFVIPSMSLGDAPLLPQPIFDVPKGRLPAYTPLVVPPSNLQPPPGIEGENKDQKPKQSTIPEIKNITLPGTDIDIPVPSNEILVTAGTTAAVSVAATLTATAIFKHVVSVMKPIIKQIVTRIQKKLNGKGRDKRMAA
tara:strand:- start:208 stop:642 length:435 start_codon:yes stop_codon:yes gene_type:complete